MSLNTKSIGKEEREGGMEAQDKTPVPDAVQDIRNICILAHVDHGKTTLADALLASNAIISNRTGNVRYLDSREDEQSRGITMKASAVSLDFTLKTMIPKPPSIPATTPPSPVNSKSESGSNNATTEWQVIDHRFLIHLIDSPGHVDFSFEVSAASKCADGALVLVDVVEGVCTQTIHVLRQAWKDKLTPILVLNKIDRLFMELHQSPSEAYFHLVDVLNSVNAVMSKLHSHDVIERDSARYEKSKSAPLTAASDEAEESNSSWVMEDGREADHIHFSPEKGNVIFASAFQGWGFRLHTFAKLFAPKFKLSSGQLLTYLWGLYYLDPSSANGISRTRKKSDAKPLFVSLILESIWKLYSQTADTETSFEEVALQKMLDRIGVKLHPREMRLKGGVGFGNPGLFKTIMSKWLPLSDVVFLAVVDQISSPVKALEAKLKPIFDRDEELQNADLEASAQTAGIRQKLMSQIIHGDISGSAVVTGFIPKLFHVAKSELPIKSIPKKTAVDVLAAEMADITVDSKAGQEYVLSEGDVKVETEEEDFSVVAFTRLYSGTLKIGQRVYLLGPRFNPSRPEPNHYQEIVISRLFKFMGRDLVDVSEGVGGHIIGIMLPSSIPFKFCTLSSSLHVPYLELPMSISPPILQVAVEPVHLSDLPVLSRSLKILDQADPYVQITLDEHGQSLLGCAGEVHLERCLTDLRHRVPELQVSKAIVPFRETLMAPPGSAKTVIVPDILSSRLKHLGEALKSLDVAPGGGITVSSEGIAVTISARPYAPPATDVDIKSDLDPLVIIAHGPKKSWDAVLCLDPKKRSCTTLHAWAERHRQGITKLNTLQSFILSAFYIAIEAGPLCREPMAGVAFVIESLCKVEDENVSVVRDDDVDLTASQCGIWMGLLKDAYKASFLCQSPRLKLAMYRCELDAPAEVLGKVYTVLSRRLGKVVTETMADSALFFTIVATLPVLESFGFSDEMRKKTAGSVTTPQLFFAGFELLEADPFWISGVEKEEDNEDEDDAKADAAVGDAEAGRAKAIMESVRLRKGLFVERKLVEHGDKQKNIKNK